MSGDLISRSDLDEYAKQCINRMKKDHDKMMNTDEKIKHRRFF